MMQQPGGGEAVDAQFNITESGLLVTKPVIVTWCAVRDLTEVDDNK
jgi:hypothetical protein